MRSARGKEFSGLRKGSFIAVPISFQESRRVNGYILNLESLQQRWICVRVAELYQLLSRDADSIFGD
jgi:hypothetical protein